LALTEDGANHRTGVAPDGDTEIDETGRSDADLADIGQALGTQPLRQFLGDLERLPLERSGELESGGGAEVADLRLGRPVEVNVRHAEVSEGGGGGGFDGWHGRLRMMVRCRVGS